jgi:hypothetical protein
MPNGFASSSGSCRSECLHAMEKACMSAGLLACLSSPPLAPIDSSWAGQQGHNKNPHPQRKRQIEQEHSQNKTKQKQRARVIRRRLRGAVVDLVLEHLGGCEGRHRRLGHLFCYGPGLGVVRTEDDDDCAGCGNIWGFRGRHHSSGGAEERGRLLCWFSGRVLPATTTTHTTQHTAQHAPGWAPLSAGSAPCGLSARRWRRSRSPPARLFDLMII